MRSSIDLSSFDVNKIKPYNTCVFIGKRGTGKTVLLKDILYNFKELPIGAVISQTAKVTKDFHGIIPDCLIHSRYKPDFIEKIFRSQEKKLENLHNDLYDEIPDRQERMEYIKSDINNYCFIVMDDMISDSKTWKNDDKFQSIFFEGRHYLIFFILTMQEPLAIPPKLRSNIDFFFITFTNNNQDIEKLYNIAGGAFNNKKEFRSVLQACTKDYSCMVVDNVVNKNEIEDRIFYYKAKIRKNFKVCLDQFWN